MEYAKVAGVDKPVSRIVFGTDRLRGRRRFRRWGLPVPGLQAKGFALLDQAFALGCNTFDTARMYWDAERMLGAWTRARGNREKVVIATKGCHPGTPTRFTPDTLTGDLHRSLKAFGGGYFDIYLLHWDDPSLPVEPMVERLNRHVKEGKILAIGVSNWADSRIDNANAFAAANGLQPLAASSVQFSLADWKVPIAPGSVSIAGPNEAAARAWYGAHDLAIFAYSSLARGFFSDRHDPEHPDDSEMSQYVATHFGTPENIERLRRARQLAKERGVTVAQVALAYVLRHPLNMFAVVGCTSAEKFAENVGALDLKLDDQTMAWLSVTEA